MALHSGTSAVGAKECASGLAVVVSLMLAPQTHEVYARAGMLSADGRCKTWDACANGYARGEGVGGVVLCDELVANGRLLLGSCVRADGRSASLTAPNGTAQALMINAGQKVLELFLSTKDQSAPARLTFRVARHRVVRVSRRCCH